MIYDMHGKIIGNTYGQNDFEAVYDLYYDRVYKYAYMLLNKEDAEDVTSETFIAAYTAFSRFDESKSSVSTWLTRIAHNRAVNLRRSAAFSKRADMPEQYEPSEKDTFTEAVEASDTVLRLYARLFPSERELLNMRCVMELKDKEISALTGIPEKTVNKRYHRLLAKCRKLLEGE